MEYASTLKKYLNVIIHEGASDLHLSVGSHPTIRVSGSLLPMLKEPEMTAADTDGLLQVMVNKRQYARFIESQETDFAYQTEDGTRFRGNGFYQRGTISIALRLI